VARQFNEGDRVVVTRKINPGEVDPETGDEWPWIWIDEMDDLVGRELEVLTCSYEESVRARDPDTSRIYLVPNWLVRHVEDEDDRLGQETKLSPEQAHDENYGRLFNTVSNIWDYQYTGYHFNDTHMLLNLDRAKIKQSDREANYLAWTRRRAKKREALKLQLKARPDLAGKRNGLSWSGPKQCLAGEKVKRVVKELTAWAEGRNPQAQIGLLHEIYRTLPRQARLKLPQKAIEAGERYSMQRGAANKPAWVSALPNGIEVFNNTLVRVSDDDPMKVCYIQNITKLMHGDDGLWTRIKPGRFLAKFHPELSEDEIRKWAEKHEAEHAPVELKFVENTDPDGWERVYESASGFSSCMQYAHPDSRYLDYRAHGEDHPVRSYAYPGNGLRLAYIGEGDKVYARTIVRDDEGHKGYIRIFGDSRIHLALEKAGYGNEVDLQGVRIARRTASWDSDSLLVPYLDSIGSVSDEGDYLVISRYGEINAVESSGVVARYTHRCERCGAAVDEDEVSYSDYEDTYHCTYCDDDFVTAVIRVGRYGEEHGAVLIDHAIEVGGTWYVNDDDLLKNAGLVKCVECDEWEDGDNVTETARGFICGCTDLVELDEEDDDGNTWAHPDDAVKALGLPELTEVWLHEDKGFDDTGLSDCEGYVLPDSEAHLALVASTQPSELNLEAA
jgi:hypothetical protein